MKQETVTLQKEEYEKLKGLSEEEDELLKKLVKGLEDIKAGRIKEWKKIPINGVLA